MRYMTIASQIVRRVRERAQFTQHELAQRAGMSQPAIAKLEQGAANPTMDTLMRCAAAAGFDLRFELVPRAAADPITERYKRDVDRTLLRQNLRTSVDHRLRSLGEWQAAGNALHRATRAARAERKRK
jgi:transcriptional regulator with XRE-family HTH domain